MSKYSHKPINVILLVLLIGCILGTALTNLIIIIMPDSIFPESVVRNFFIQKTVIGFDDIKVDLNVMKFTLGFKFDVSILSILGIGISWYFLRYFK